MGEVVKEVPKTLNLNNLISILEIPKAGVYHPDLVSYCDQLRMFVRGNKMAITPFTEREIYYAVYKEIFEHFVNMGIDLQGQLIDADKAFIEKGLVFLNEMKEFYGE